MARKVQAAGKRGGRDEGEKVVHRLKDVFGNVEETLIRKVLASCENDFDAAANALLSKRKTNELAGQWKETNNYNEKKRKSRRVNSSRSEGFKRKFFTVFVYGLPWTAAREEIEEELFRVLDPEAKGEVLEVRIPTDRNAPAGGGGHGGFVFADVVEKPLNYQTAAKLQSSAASGELFLFGKQVGLEVQAGLQRKGQPLDLISDLEAVDVRSRRYGRGTRPGCSDGKERSTLFDANEVFVVNREEKQKEKPKQKSNPKFDRGAATEAYEEEGEMDLVDAFNQTMKRKAELKLELVELDQREQELREKIRSELVVLQRRCERMSMVSTTTTHHRHQHHQHHPMSIGETTMMQGPASPPLYVPSTPPAVSVSNSPPDLPSPPSMQNASTLCWSSRVKLT